MASQKNDSEFQSLTDDDDLDSLGGDEDFEPLSGDDDFNWDDEDDDFDWDDDEDDDEDDDSSFDSLGDDFEDLGSDEDFESLGDESDDFEPLGNELSFKPLSDESSFLSLSEDEEEHKESIVAGAVPEVPLDSPLAIEHAFSPAGVKGVQRGKPAKRVEKEAIPGLEARRVSLACDSIVNGKDVYKNLVYLSRVKTTDVKALFEA